MTPATARPALRLAEAPPEVFVSPPSGHRTPARALIERPRLVRRLATTDLPVVLVVAPAGYGKTAVLEQWEQRDARPFAWVSLSRAHDDAGVLWSAIAEAMSASQPDVDDTARVPEVLVLDGAEVLEAADAFDVVGEITANVTPGSTVAIASRVEPSVPIGRLRADGAILELRSHDLAMTPREAAALLRRAGLRLEPTQVEVLATATEGWPAALQLAVQVLLDQGDVDTAVERFAGDDRLVADYVHDEMLCGLAPDELVLLEHSAPLDRLSGGLCDAVLRRHGSGRTLRRLARAGLPLTPLDRSEEQYRLHPLLSDALRAELRRTDPALEPEIHRRASAWHEEAGELDAAIDHAIAAGDTDRAATLLWTAMPTFAAQGRTAAVERWLDRLDEHEIAARPALALAAASTRVARGERDVAERWLAAAERAMLDAQSPAPAQLTAAATALRAAIGRDGVAQMGRDAARARELASAGSPWRAVAGYLEGVALHLGGEREAAVAALDEAARCAATASPSVRILCLAQLAILAFESDDGASGSVVAAQARAAVEQARLAESPACAMAFAASAFAMSQGGPVDDARRDAAQARRLLAGLADAAPWFDAQVRVLLARTELRLSDASAARSLLVEASRALRTVPETTSIHEWIDDTWARADTFAAGAVVGPSTLTTAELRVLRFLPSHLSFREIAARLHVSANTVKTQAHAVYRKLDASSRSEAVARARSVGLVDG